ncbi:uncharacterized protein P174DRAFT_454873 [Aspergillus novofumigatus IBT 16806]|uniref:Catalase core domain-containing protein n=1 Tax=Aspergillus novofumigatus (strain IBT 16806) TaxID=1392255 RepID=A0A2I1BUV7_ASPN1|nr:uncharacterized protein P174DRAFT_454873 [Aspergillus novofumigatus IBT 16806]PKX89149.1 hypothetical protein P174DRAFT_454873 [Aspergillus novofumigatus IBT 16806]
MAHQSGGVTYMGTGVTHSNGWGIVYVKYHFVANHGQKQFTADEALWFGGKDPDFSKRDLWQAIEKGEQIGWTAHVQIMRQEETDPSRTRP